MVEPNRTYLAKTDNGTADPLEQQDIAVFDATIRWPLADRETGFYRFLAIKHVLEIGLDEDGEMHGY
jgi:hypothetical protein